MAGKNGYRRWTAEEERELRRLWAEGVRGTDLTQRFGRARGSVGTKVSQLGLPPRKTISHPAERRANAGATGLAQARAVQPPAAPPTPPRRPRPAAPGWVPKTCQWLHGDARERNFCGAEVKPGSSYCPRHHGRVFRTAAEPDPDHAVA